MLNKAINVLKKYTNIIVNSDLIIIFTGLVLFGKMCFFYERTIYFSDVMQKEIVEKTFIYSMYLVTLLFILKNKSRFICAYIINLFMSILMLADEIYYNYSSSLISIVQISNLQYSDQISATIGDLTNFSQILYFLDLIIVIVLLITKFIKIENIKRKSWKPAILYVTIMTIIFESTIPNYIAEAKESRYNKKMQLELGTLYTFHYLDIQSNINLKKTAKYNSKNDVLNAYNNLKQDYNQKYEKDIYNLKNVAEGKNVILLQLESLQNFVINKKINDKEITPNINKFLNENIKINNMIIQSYSTTADSEHSAMSSLYPLENGMAFAQYSGNKYNDIFDLYKEKNYYTVYMHGNEETFWNRKNVYNAMQIDEIDFIDSFDPDSELINNWISDEALYKQAVEKLKKTDTPFFTSIVASSSHTGFDLPGLDNKYQKVSIDVGKYKDTYFGNYLEAVNYADYAFGAFIEKLKEENLYDDTVIFIFGDHYGMQMHNEEMLDFIKECDHELNNVETEINYVNVVCGIKIPEIENIEIEKTVSKLDIKPTLSYICGLSDEVSLGTNIFGTKDFACLNNGIIVSDDYYYNGVWYERLNGKEINLDNLDDGKKNLLNYYKNKMEDELTISNSIVLNNLLK
ncbi:sulfatase [Clostridium sp. CAG:492]|nr:sulfatase [Clostridium sp. CAG:492]